MRKVSVELGGTGSNTASGARTALGIENMGIKGCEVLSKSGAYPVVLADDGKLITADVSGGGFTITLPLVSSVYNGFTIGVKKIDSSSNIVTIDANGSETIDDALTSSISTQYETQWFIVDAGEWWINSDAKKPGSGGRRVLLFSNTVSSVANVDISSSDLDWTAYNNYEIEYSDIHVNTDGAELRIQVYDSGLGDWLSSNKYKTVGILVGGGSVNYTSVANTNINITGQDSAIDGLGNASDESFNASIQLQQVNETAYKLMNIKSHYLEPDNSLVTLDIVANIATSNSISGIRVYVLSGVIDDGKLAIYGVNVE